MPARSPTDDNETPATSCANDMLDRWWPEVCEAVCAMNAESGNEAEIEAFWEALIGGIVGWLVGHVGYENAIRFIRGLVNVANIEAERERAKTH